MGIDDETPIEELIRAARETANELYFIRADNSYRVPGGVMKRLREAIRRVEQEQP